MRGSRLPHAQFSLQYLKFSLKYTMGNMFCMFSSVFWGIRTLKCEAVYFLKFNSAGIPVRPFEYLGTLILITACAPCTCMHDAHVHCDVTRFTYDVSHVTMTSPAFTFHSCHIEIRWQDLIGSHCRNTKSPWIASHRDDVGMTSSCSHHVHSALMTSPCSDHDVIATCVNHDFSCGT